MHPNQSKIFGIGLSKTGTSSLARALEILGYKTRDYLGVSSYTPGDLSSIDLDEIDRNDALTDTPVPSFYRELDAHYPDSKFILTERDTDGWLQSCKKQFTAKLADKLNDASNRLFMDLYGCTVFDEQKFRRGYTKFTHGVHQYFTNRPQDLLIMDIAAGDGWDKLCNFLDVPIPDIPFPRANVTRIRWLDINKIIAIAQQAGNELLRAHKIIQANHAGQDKRQAERHGIAGTVFKKTKFTLLGGADGIQQSAIKKVERIINKKLKEQNPGIPVISRQNNSTPYSERRKWNHFWLIDPLDSNAGLLAPGDDFTINIALIEDRRPVLGIVYVAAKNTTYYTMTGKDAFKVKADEEPKILEACPARGQKLSAHTEQGEISRVTQQELGSHPASIALSMCLAAEGQAGTNASLNNTMEWETAGAHAIIESAGMTVISCDTNSELAYNKENFGTGALLIK